MLPTLGRTVTERAASNVITNLSCLVLLLQLLCDTTKAGQCWITKGENGRCQGILKLETSKEDCCSRNQGATVSWTPHEDISSGKLFYWTALAGGAPECQPCRDTCAGVECAPGKKCKMRNNKPKCVCAPQCKNRRHQPRGSLCGTDRKNYNNYCQMLKFNCRHSRNVDVNYYGKCQRSCDAVECPRMKQCITDQDGLPHCVECIRNCPDNPHVTEAVCGADGQTYKSHCHFRRDTCMAGENIAVAYTGPCKSVLTCTNMTCGAGLECLHDAVTSQPVCTECGASCRHLESEEICGSDGNTYSSWCQMRRRSCRRGIYVETQHSGPCHRKSLRQSLRSSKLRSRQSGRQRNGSILISSLLTK